MKKRILLNVFPPFGIIGPAAGVSILKAFLEKEGYTIDIKYWNIAFESLFKQLRNHLPDLQNNENDKLTCITMAYQAVKTNDKRQIDKAIDFFLDRGPQLHAKGRIHIYMLLQKFTQQVDLLIEREWAKIDLTQYMYVGSSLLLYQWAYSNVIIGKMKALHPEMPCVIGGISTPKEAETFLRNFALYDYAIWGEGEYPLLELTKHIENGEGSAGDIASLAYREGDTLRVNAKRKKYLDMNGGLMPDYTDFFEQMQTYRMQDSARTRLRIEGGRGCHWNQCKFCYLNSGFSFRTKDAVHLMAELRAQLKKYPCSTVTFTDNDIIGNNPENFDRLLDELIRYKSTENPNFLIGLAEVITKSCTFELIKKMRAAGLYTVQIGYESPSDELLKKIHKSTSFAYNLFFLKWANIFAIEVDGLNVIQNLLEETDQDIEEAIDNLLFLRFILNVHIHHTYGLLGIKESSRYYKELIQTNSRTEYERIDVWRYLPDDCIADADKDIILEIKKEQTNPLWDTFTKLEQYYLKNKCTYTLAAINGEIHYNETEDHNRNTKIRQNLTFREDGLDWQLMEMCNKKVCSKTEMAEAFPQYKAQLDDTLKELKKEGLVYYNSDQSEIVTVINTDAVE